jgi:Lanthionine synthetase C-like protein
VDPTLQTLYPVIEEKYPAIADTISALCHILIKNDGHLPMAVPEWRSKRPSALVQICHGTPGILVLLAVAGLNPVFSKAHWRPEWLETVARGSDVVWQQGLLSKGGGLCHGIAGNAYPLLLLSVVFSYGYVTLGQNGLDGLPEETKSVLLQDGHLSGDALLGKALAMLLECRNTRPFKIDFAEGERHYRMPDHPFSLFEGLAGTACAWADAIAIIRARLRKFELEVLGMAAALDEDQDLREIIGGVQGFPCLGGAITI